ncbi:hypothetical protein B0H15DRAFT_783563 [Mycena belliarum]|uniref:Gag protein n=1 Tax=Mycena belliarum TaxID=1033014 RepID=A0AAD6U3U4_9AGAR|nr:hypothetical protein B0H15DRAFT_783563 [Mycena belliae]
MSAEIVPMFAGEPASAESTAVTPATFIKKFRAHMRDLGTDNAPNPNGSKIDAFPDYLVEDSPAEKWFRDLQTGANAVVTWQALEVAFHTRFPGPEKAERTPQEWERELAGMKLTLAELDTTVNVGGSDVFAHIHYASRLLAIARLAGIADTTSGIWQSRDALPEVIRDKVPATQATWVTYTAAIKAVDRTHIRDGVVKAKKAQQMARDVADLKARATPLTPVSKVSAQLSRTGIATPRAATAPLPARAQGGANPFAGGGGQGNLFTPPAGLSEEALVTLRKIVAKLRGSMLQDDAAGRAEYERRIAGWERIHGNKKVLLEHSGYPLSPGTAPPCSGECYRCGKVTSPRHTRVDCPGPHIPNREGTFRSICSKYLSVRRPVAVNAVLEDDLAWIDFAEPDEDEADFGEGPSE